MIHARPVAIAMAAAVSVASCGSEQPERDPEAMAAGGIVSQSALFCPNEGFSWEAFEAAAQELGAAPDDGEVVRPVTAREHEIVRMQWVALNHAGHRTTAWIAELGPGVRYQDGIAPVEHRSGLVCAIHDPSLGREEAFALTRGWEGGETTGAVPAPDMPGGILTAVRTWVNSGPGSNFYQEIEMRVRDREATDGAMLIRHRYEYGSEPAA